MKERKKSKKFLSAPRMKKIMAMLSSAILVGKSSYVDSSRCCCHELSMTPMEESVDRKFVGLGYLKENSTSNLTAEEFESLHERFRIP